MYDSNQSGEKSDGQVVENNEATENENREG